MQIVTSDFYSQSAPTFLRLPKTNKAAPQMSRCFFEKSVCGCAAMFSIARRRSESSGQADPPLHAQIPTYQELRQRGADIRFDNCDISGVDAAICIHIGAEVCRAKLLPEPRFG